jgi:tetratricopeptide (TPR) repeat protein
MRRGPGIAFSALLALMGLGASGCMDAATEHRTRANAYLRGNDASAALNECDRGLARRPNDLALLILRGKALFELDRLDDAKQSYAGALEAGKGKEDRALAEAYVGLAMIASRQGDWGSARRNFELLVRINDKDASSHVNVARSCLELKDFACALEHGEAAGKLRGDDEAVLYTLGTIYLAAGKTQDAELTFQHICDVVPGASSCPYGVALAAAKLGDKSRALARLREAIDRKVPNPAQIARDPGFASLRDDPEFALLVARANPNP